MQPNYVYVGKPFNPLIPKGLYEAVISSVKEDTFSNGQKCLVIEWTLTMEPYKGRIVKDFFSIYDTDPYRRAQADGDLHDLVVGVTGSKELQSWNLLLRKMAAIKLEHRQNKKTGKDIHYVAHRIPKGKGERVAPIPQASNAPILPDFEEDELSRL